MSTTFEELAILGRWDALATGFGPLNALLPRIFEVYLHYRGPHYIDEEALMSLGYRLRHDATARDAVLHAMQGSPEAQEVACFVLYPMIHEALPQSVVVHISGLLLLQIPGLRDRSTGILALCRCALCLSDATSRQAVLDFLSGCLRDGDAEAQGVLTQVQGIVDRFR